LTEAEAELAAVALILIIVFSNVIGIILGLVIESDFNVPIRSNIFLLLFVFSVTLSFLVSILKFSNLKPPVVRDLLVLLLLLLLRINELVRFEIVFVSLLVESFLRRPLYSNAAAAGSFLFVIVSILLFIS
jgi:hypothetical protein